MCGIAGFLGGRIHCADGAGLPLLEEMTEAIAVRGPDDAGHWYDPNCDIGLGHRRLAILDRSAQGHQPMTSASGRFVLSFNGEIYNHAALRRDLEIQGLAPSWRGHSDTETLLAGFDAWGIEPTVKRTIGMFAIAVWDRKTGTLILARDRIGEKPLYYGWHGAGRDTVFLFASELKALRKHPAFEGRVSRAALALFIRHGYVPAPHSIHEGTAKLMPGTLLEVSLRDTRPALRRYWSAAQAADSGASSPFGGSETEAVDELEALLGGAVRQQMAADVPLGGFLSGGIDSSTIVALMQAQSGRPVKTFTIGYHEAGYNEAEHAKAVARHLGTDHTELYVSSQEAMAAIPRLPMLYDEPFADVSQIPTFLLSQLAKTEVTVALSGDAGDELFCGYNRYRAVSRLWNMIAPVPIAARRLAARALLAVSPQSWDAMAERIGAVLPRAASLPNIGDKIHKGAVALESETADSLYMKLVSHWQDPASVVLDGQEQCIVRDDALSGGFCDVERMMLLDMQTYLPDDILVKLDRAAMGVSLETRVPFLDHRVVEFAWRLPIALKLRDGKTKWPLRQILYRYMPPELVERPKMGFGVPIGSWLRGPLRHWAESLMDEERLRDEGFFRPEPIRRKWEEHLSGRRNWGNHIWNVLMFQAWRAEYLRTVCKQSSKAHHKPGIKRAN